MTPQVFLRLQMYFGPHPCGFFSLNLRVNVELSALYVINRATSVILSAGSGENKIFIIKSDLQSTREASLPQFSFPFS